jgi:hypothetical protein
VWDALSGECLEVIDNYGDLAAVAAAEEAFPWRAVSGNWEMVIEPGGGGEAVAWFPAAIRHITIHPSGRVWARVDKQSLDLIRLEGKQDLQLPGGASR